jgi:ferric-dicitrate binding protein FerR (iron transport regulator)
MNATENRLREALDEAARSAQNADPLPLVATRAPSRFRRRALAVAVASGLVVAVVGMQLWPTSSNLVGHACGHRPERHRPTRQALPEHG